MKIIITSKGNQPGSLFDLRFGRAGWFCLFDKETGKTTFFENENMNANSGVGVKTAEKMVELGVDKIISGDFGPKAKEILDRFNIQMVIIQDDESTIGDILNRLK